MYDFKMTARLRTNIMKQRPIFEQKNFSFRREEKEHSCNSLKAPIE